MLFITYFLNLKNSLKILMLTVLIIKALYVKDKNDDGIITQNEC